MEDWCIIKNFPNYEVSNFGKIRNKKTLRVLKETLRNGYPSVSLCKDSKSITTNIHQVVASTFLEKIDNKIVNHKDGNTLNNHADNLEWVTKSENMKHAYEQGLNKKVRNVLQYENDNGVYGNFLGEFISVAEASRETGIAEHEIRASCKKQGGYTVKKYLWKYKNEEETEKYELKYTSKVKYSKEQKDLVDDKFKILDLN
jgi:hypothetical protein